MLHIKQRFDTMLRMAHEPTPRNEPSRLPVRRRPAHGVDYSFDDQPIIFITVCSQGRRKWIAEDRVHSDLISVWNEARAWRVGGTC
jgi:hypothetical protein